MGNALKAHDALFLAFKTIGLSERTDPANGKKRKPVSLLSAAAHNLREIQAERGADARIDAKRISLNRVLHGSERAADIQSLGAELLAKQGIDSQTLRRDHVQAIEAVFSLPADTQIDPLAFFGGCVAWIEKAMRLPMLSAVVHFDETAPHCHVLLLPVRDGEHLGAKLIEKNEVRKLNTRFDRDVGMPAGLQRSRAKFYGEAKKWAVVAVMRECEARGLPAANGPLWPLFERLLATDPTEAVRLLGLDLNTMRADYEAGKPIGLTPPPPIPIGFENVPKMAGKNVNLSCVGLPAMATPNEATKGQQATSTTTATAAPMQSLAGCPKAERLTRGRAAMQSGYDRQAARKPTPKPPPLLVAREDGRMVDRSDAQDAPAWGC